MLTRLAWLAVAGALGTLARYGLSGLAHRLFGASFPWGTLAVNLAGCFLAGLAWALFEYRWQISSQWRVIILVGFMGGFTTFSAFMLETSHILRDGQWLTATANLCIQNILGLFSMFAGLWLGKTL